MAKRPAHTVILLGANRTDRVDFDADPAFTAVAQHHQLWQGADDLVSRVEGCLAIIPRLGKKVWVLWEGAAVNILEMPAAVVTGLERQQLADAMSFEAEPLTGILAADSAIDGIPQRNAPGALAEFRRFWITQISADVRAKLDEVVIAAGAKLGGIAHPGGLPRERWDSAIAPETIHEWRRIEIWEQLTFILHGRSDGTVETRLTRSSPGSEGWAAELPTEGPLSWMGPGPVSRVSPDGHRVPDALTPVDVQGIPLQPVKVDLPAAAPVEWLRAWASELTATTRRVPVVESSRQTSPNQKYYVFGGVAAALVLGACALHGGLIAAKTSTLRAEADHREAMRAQMAAANDSKRAKEVASLAAESKTLLATLKELDQTKASKEAECAKAEANAADYAKRQSRLSVLKEIHRPALAELVSAVADAERSENAGDIVIKDIRQQRNGDLWLSGLCRQAVVSDAFATKLEERLSGAGWRVGAAQKQRRDDGLAFDFAVVLTPLVLLDSSYAGPQASPFRPAAAPSTAPVVANAQHSSASAVTPTPTGGHRP